MALKKLTPSTKPPRRWALVGYPIAGKSTFATRMNGPLVVADIDGRFAEVHTLAGKDNVSVLQLDAGRDASDANAWAEQIEQDLAREKFGTLIADSVTPVLEPLFYDVAETDNPKERNKLLLHKAATANRFFNALVRHSNDVLLIWHLKDSMVNGQGSTRTTLSKTETERLRMHLNAIIEIIVDKKTGMRGALIAWARNGRDNHTIWDESGSWVGMPEKIEAHLYGAAASPQAESAPAAAATASAPAGESSQPGDGPLPEAPVSFANKAGALDWAVKQGAFPNTAAAGAAYDKLKTEKGPKTAGDMFQMWRTYVGSLKTAA